MIKRLITFVVLALAVAGLVSKPAYADEGNVGFSIQKVNEGDSRGKSESYFDLAVTPSQELEIETKIISQSDTPVEVRSEIFSAFTNENGIIDYTAKAKKYDKSLTIKLSDITEIHASDLKVDVQKDATKTVRATIKVPDNAPDGVILGSWYFTLADNEEADKEEAGVSSRYAYSLGIKLTVNKEIDQPNLNLTSVTTGIYTYQKAFFANFQNDQRAILSQLTIDARVTKRGKFDTLYQNKAEVSMAPNSNYPFPIKLGDDQMKPGEYTMRVTATTTDPKWAAKTWTWDMNFTVLKADADEANKAAFRDAQPKSFPWWLLVIAIVITLLLLAFLFFLLWKRRKKKEEESGAEADSQQSE